MGLSRSRTLFLIVLLSLAVLSLRPETKVDDSLGALFAPARVLGVLAAPVRWCEALAGRNVRAASDDDTARAEIEASRAFLAAERSAARPNDPTLRSGRGFVIAEVVLHLDKQRDTVEIVFDPSAHLEPGMPVVCGDVYVGRVKELDPVPGGAKVALVTGSTFRVGAHVDSESDAPSDNPSSNPSKNKGARATDLIVGGLLAKHDGGAGLELAAQFIRDRSVDSGLVRVRESDALRIEPYRDLADGYLLGELEVLRARGIRELCVEARIAYEGGLSEVAVVCPDPLVQSDLSARDPFDAASWIEASFVVAGNPSPWRAAAVLASGADQGLADRAAIALGPRLLGRVTSAGRLTSDASLLGDAGFQMNVVASIEGDARPIALGRLTSCGVERGSDVLVLRAEREIARLAGGADHARRATLYTAAGDLGIPPGLWIGTAELPAMEDAQRGDETRREDAHGVDAHDASARGKNPRGSDANGKNARAADAHGATRSDPSAKLLRVHAPQTQSPPATVGVWRIAQIPAARTRE